MTGELLAVTGWALAAAAAGVAVVACHAGRLRGELVARARHELAGPLSAAGLVAEALRRDLGRVAVAAVGASEGPAPGAAQRLDALDLELQRARRALADLDAARRGRRAADRPAVVDVGVLVGRQAVGWAAVARASDREVEVRIAAGAVVAGDAVRLAQATGNLVANALEHGAGPVTIEVVVRRDRVRVEVADRGPGLPAPIDALVARARAGRGERGRGLAIAAEVAAAHGGRLAGAPAAGTRLVLDLPALERAR